MGEVERLHKHFNKDKASLLEKVKKEMESEWERYKRSRLMLHGEEITDNRLDMLLMYLIKKGIV